MKTPLRYPGGKSRAVKTILEFVPEDCGELCSPFLGGGSVELALAEKGVKVHGYEGFKPVVWFWQAILKDPEKLADLADSFRKKKVYEYQGKKLKERGLPERTFHKLKRDLVRALRKGEGFSFELAAKFYALNRSSFSGATLSGGFSERASYARFTDSRLDYVRNFKAPNLTVQHADFKKSIKNHDCLLYLDPPYFLGEARSKLYGNVGDMHKFFPHLSLYSELKEKKNWILSYNNCDEIRHLYRDYEIHDASWTYCMTTKESSEIIITNL